ncbi:hypothetical protein [Nannocystis pusilla]|uniref:hypothetical protein n=1 Tax=Nannocystis pusilla TaxID=889268 RepID=UPI003B812C9E
MHQAAKEPAPPRDERRVLWYLRKIPLLEGVGGEHLRALAAVVEIKEFAGGRSCTCRAIRASTCSSCRAGGSSAARCRATARS